jgi:N-acyl-L-homoserine lactone synthetase
MIDAISLENAHLLGDALASTYRLRHRIFVERQKYEVPNSRGMEWDQFDTPAAVYLVWRDQRASVRAVARLIPTSFPYMIQQLWPEMVERGELPCRDDVWEVTRFGIDRDLERDQRSRIFGEMFCAFAEFGLRNGVKGYMFATPAQVIRSALGLAGVEFELLGIPKRLGRLPVVAARSAVTHEALHKLRCHHRVSGSVLRMADDTCIEAEAA